MVLGVNGYGNMWQYSPFGAAGYVSPSITAPVDTLGAQNDMALFWNNAGVDRAVADSAALTYSIVPILKQFQADISKYWQGLMTSNNSSSNWTFNPIERHNPFTIEYRDGADGASDSTKIKETEILAGLEKMGRGKAVSDVMNQEIEVDGVKTTLLKHLMDLVEEHRKDPTNARLSEENYNKIWDIVDRYIKNGDLSTQDIKTLLEIARDPSSTSADDGNDSKDPGKPTVIPEKVEAIVNDFKDAIIGAGTDTKKLGNAVEAVNKDNILEVMEEYSRYVRAHKPSEKDNLIEAILADCRLWGGGDSDGWDMVFNGPVMKKILRGAWFAKQGDDAKPRLEFIQEALIDRANELIKNYGEECGITKEDIQAFTLPQEESYRYFDKKRDDDAILKSFNTFIAKLQAAEKAVYGEDE